MVTSYSPQQRFAACHRLIIYIIIYITMYLVLSQVEEEEVEVVEEVVVEAAITEEVVRLNQAPLVDANEDIQTISERHIQDRNTGGAKGIIINRDVSYHIWFNCRRRCSTHHTPTYIVTRWVNCDDLIGSLTRTFPEHLHVWFSIVHLQILIASFPSF